MRFYVIDHHPLMALGLTRLLRNLCPYSHITAVERMSLLQPAVVLGGEPHLIVFDLLVPGIKNPATLQELRAHYPHSVIVVFTELNAPDLEQNCIAAGADVVLSKGTKLLPLQRHLAKALAQRFPNDAAQVRSKPLRLTARQTQLLHTIEYGMSNADIASLLSLSPHTIKVHLWRMFQRFHVNNRLQLIRFAHDNGLF